MKIDKKSILLLLILLLILSYVLVLNLKTVGREPLITGISKTVVYPGDTIEIMGEYFGDEVTKGRIFINNQMIFESFINKWSHNLVSLTLPDDFSSGMLKISNMFGSSAPILITSIKDVPRVKIGQEILGTPYIDSISIVDELNNIFLLTGRNLANHFRTSSIQISFKDNLDKDCFMMVNNNRVNKWTNDEIIVYMPLHIRNFSVSVKNPNGFSNSVNISNNVNTGLKISYTNYTKYNIYQSVDVLDIVALKNSSINLFVPCLFPSDTQRDIILETSKGYYSKKTNTLDYILDVNKSGDNFSISQNTFVEIYEKEFILNGSFNQNYDKKSPDYLNGFQVTPGVLLDKELSGGSVWIVRNTNSNLSKVNLITDWAIKYISLDLEGSESSSSVYSTRKGNERGYVNVVTAMLRASGVPARVITGVKLEEDNDTYRWIEFLLPGGGWVPLDIIEKKNNPIYPVGKLENNRIIFTKGVNYLESYSDNYDNDLYALQNRTHNYKGNIDNYKTVWHNIKAEKIKEE